MKAKLVLLATSALVLSACAETLPTLPPAAFAPPVEEPVAEALLPVADRDPREVLGQPLTYTWSADREFTVYAKVGGLTPIVLLPGERIDGESLANPDNWRIDDRPSYGSGRSSTPVLMVSPDVSAKATTAIVTTSARMYLLRLVPHRTGNRLVRFLDGERRHTVALSAPDWRRTGPDYTLKGDPATWQPVRVRDDGARTWVELPPHVGATGLPALFALDNEGNARPVNSRRVGRFLVADGVFPSGVKLTLGGQTIEARRAGA